MPFVQTDRLIRMTKGPLADDQIFMTGFSGQESISRLFNFQLRFVSTELDLKSRDLVGKPVGIELDRRDPRGNVLDPPRYFDGYISRLVAGDVTLHETKRYKYREYRAEMVPWLWFLSQTARCFIFFPEREEKSIYEIIEAVLQRAAGELKIAEAKFDLRGLSELKRHRVKHCVQYRESDFNFLSRIMEQYGAYYYFEHDPQACEHTLVLSAQGNYPSCTEAAVTFPADLGTQTQEDHINDWQHEYEFVSGRFEHTDYNFTTPLTSLRANSGKIADQMVGETESFEVYDYPGEYQVVGDGEALARIRQEEEEVPHDIVRGSSTCRSFTAGYKFALSSHPDQDVVSEQGNRYLLTTVRHRATQPPPETDVEVRSDYDNDFICIPDHVQFRPARTTPKPVVSGIQTAVVVGPKGEEIHTNQYGQVMVRFFWDREENRRQVADGEKFFCWVRVAHNIAGKQWGFMAIPRIGQEVVVDFLEGDPDRPLVVGSVYNEEQMPHYGLPDEKTKTYIKTNSSKGGEGFNELCFEDKTDDERVFIHAQKNMDTRVLNDSKSRILHDRHQIIGEEKDGKKVGDQREQVWQDKHSNVKRNQVEHIEGNMQVMVGNGDAEDGGTLDLVVEKDRRELIQKNDHLHVEGFRHKKIDGDQCLIVEGNQLEKIEGSEHRTIGGGQAISVGGSKGESIGGDHATDVGGIRDLNIGSDQNIEVAGNHSLAAGGNQDLTAGGKHAIDAGMEVHIKAGMNVVIEAGMQVSLVAPGGFITISSAGIAIQGTTVLINSGGAAGSGSGASPTAPASPAAPEQPEEADDAVPARPTTPDEAHDSKTGHKSARESD